MRKEVPDAKQIKYDIAKVSVANRTEPVTAEPSVEEKVEMESG